MQQLSEQLGDRKPKMAFEKAPKKNFAPYLAAIRGEHVRAAMRSIDAALIELPVLEAVRFSREGNSEIMG